MITVSAEVKNADVILEEYTMTQREVENKKSRKMNLRAADVTVYESRRGSSASILLR